MVDLMVDTEFIKIGKDRYINKLGNGQVYSRKEIIKMMIENQKELKKFYEVKSETNKTNRGHKGKRCN